VPARTSVLRTTKCRPVLQCYGLQNAGPYFSVTDYKMPAYTSVLRTTKCRPVLPCYGLQNASPYFSSVVIVIIVVIIIIIIINGFSFEISH
jgi:hypothetical protein